LYVEWLAYRVAGQQQLVYFLEDVSICAETGGVSAAVCSQVRLVNVAEGSHQLLEVAGCQTQGARREDSLTFFLTAQEVTLRRTEVRQTNNSIAQSYFTTDCLALSFASHFLCFHKKSE